MSSCAALAEKPGRIEKLFLNKEKSPTGIYGVNLYRLGVPITYIIDDYLPLRDSEEKTIGGKYNPMYEQGDALNGKLTTIFAKIGGDNGNGLWAALIEKALAKFHGNYIHLDEGYGDMGLATLTGAPYKKYDHKIDFAFEDSFFEEILA